MIQISNLYQKVVESKARNHIPQDRNSPSTMSDPSKNTSKQPVNLYPGLNDIADALEELPLTYSKYLTLWKEIGAKCVNTQPDLRHTIDGLLHALDTQTASGGQLVAVNQLFQELMPSIEEKLHVSSIALESVQQIVERLELAYEVSIKNEEIPVKLRLGNNNHPAMHLHYELMEKAEREAGSMSANGSSASAYNAERRGNTRSAAAAAAAAAASAAMNAASGDHNDFNDKKSATSGASSSSTAAAASSSSSSSFSSRKRQRTGDHASDDDSNKPAGSSASSYSSATSTNNSTKKKEKKRATLVSTTSYSSTNSKKKYSSDGSSSTSITPNNNANGSTKKTHGNTKVKSSSKLNNNYDETEKRLATGSSSSSSSSSARRRGRRRSTTNNDTGDIYNHGYSDGEDGTHVGEEDDADEEVDGEGEEEEVYCTCRSVAYGDMIACDYKDCKYEWFHLSCIGLTKLPKGKWYCKDCAPLVNNSHHH